MFIGNTILKFLEKKSDFALPYGEIQSGQSEHKGLHYNDEINWAYVYLLEHIFVKEYNVKLLYFWKSIKNIGTHICNAFSKNL